MRAMVMTAFGGPEVLQMRDVEKPTAGPGELLVRVLCAAVNPVDAKIRADGRWSGITPPAVLGYDAAGVVEAVGAGVSDLGPGDEVYFTPEIFRNRHGTYAEYTVVPAALAARKPANLDAAAAAAVPLAGGTAWDAIVRRLVVRPGETVLIQGGAGGVGSFAVQFAHAAGARVLASAGPDHQDVLRKLGADVAIDYTRDDPADVALRETGQHGVDAALVTTGGDVVGRTLRALRPWGRVAHILPPGGDLTLGYMRNLTLHGVFLDRERRRLDEMRRLIEHVGLTPLVAEVLPLERLPDAHRRLETGHGAGKLVLRIA